MPSPLLKPINIENEEDKDQCLAYYSEVLNAVGAPPVEVQLDVGGKGKGIVATRDICEGETVFIERPLVSLQHIENKAQIVCHQCLRFVGSVERQIGNKLSCLVDELKAAYRGAAPADGAAPGEDSENEDVDLEGALAAGERLEQIFSHVTRERILELSSGAGQLPLSGDFQMPQPIPCRRGCGALYCSAACEAAAWQHSHCLLCTAPAPAPQPPTTAKPSGSAAAATEAAPSSFGERESEQAAGSAGCSSSQATAAAQLPVSSSEPSTSSSSSPAGPSTSATPAAEAAGASTSAVHVEELYGIRVDRRALAAFAQHAADTNEIFLLAAQVVAATLLKAAKLLEQQQPESAAATAAATTTSTATAGSGAGSSTAAGPASTSAATLSAGGGCAGSLDASGQAAAGSAATGAAARWRAALCAAWRQYTYAWKRSWWEAVAVPEDVEDEQEFRGQLRELASDSLELLSAAISDPRFGPELLQLEVYGSIVGMFELNNLGLSVCSPVEDFFLAVDEMEEGAEKDAVLRVTQPLLDALDSEYATPCEATAFMALQSCINHSCDPNCTAACDTGDRTVMVLAQRDIAAGEEVTLSYIDVNMPYKQRQAELADYGFVCRCSRCTTEAAAARAKRQGAAGKGLKVGRRR